MYGVRLRRVTGENRAREMKIDAREDGVRDPGLRASRWQLDQAPNPGSERLWTPRERPTSHSTRQGY